MTSTQDRRPTLERFIDRLQHIIGTEAASEGLRARVELLHRTAPVARAIVFFENTLAGPGGSDTLDAFIDAEEARARRETPDPADPDDGCARAAAAGDAAYFAGIVIGLLLADTL